MVANDISKKGVGFGSEDNDVLIIHSDGRTVRTGRQGKPEISRVIFDQIEGLLGEKKE